MAIGNVEEKIEKVEEEIKQLEPQINVAAQKALERGDDREYWRKREEHLREKENKLRKREEQLREEKNKLREEKNKLREKEDKLREEKNKLLEKEDKLLAQSAGDSQVGFSTAMLPTLLPVLSNQSLGFLGGSSGPQPLIHLACTAFSQDTCPLTGDAFRAT